MAESDAKVKFAAEILLLNTMREKWTVGKKCGWKNGQNWQSDNLNSNIPK